MGVTDGSRKKESGHQGAEESTHTPQSVLQTRMESSLHHNSVCTVDLRKKEALGLGSILTDNH